MKEANTKDANTKDAKVKDVEVKENGVDLPPRLARGYGIG